MCNMKTANFLFVILSIVFFSCSNDDDEQPIQEIDNNIQLTEILKKEMLPLSTNEPLGWKDSELTFLDAFKNKSIVALGEATHGTAEFFEAKHRIYKYLVENLGFRVFAIEADYGESIFFNDAIQQGKTDTIEYLMNTRMGFWTWKTEEVKDMLEWMCNYNKDKGDNDKVHYVGIDCQTNRYDPALFEMFLDRADAPFNDNARVVMDDIRTYNQSNYNMGESSFGYLLDKLETIVDSLDYYQSELETATSEWEFSLYRQMVVKMRQTTEVRYHSKKGTEINYRDKYMAENAAWAFNTYNYGKVVVWAHNGHIANNGEYWQGASMGNHLSEQFAEDYGTVGFLFSKGSFTAVEQKDGEFSGLKSHTISSKPKKGSLNAIMYDAEQVVFSIDIDELMEYQEWELAFSGGIEYFQIGAAFSGSTGNYYGKCYSGFFDKIIYIDNSTASVLLE